MNRTHLAITASSVLATLCLVAAAWAAPTASDGGAGAPTGSGGAKANPVVPSGGGGGEPGDSVEQQGGTDTGQAIEVPQPETTLQLPPAQTDEGTETETDEEIVLPLEDEDAEREKPASGGAPAEEGDSGGGAFGFLASTGFELAALVTAGAGLVIAGLVVRSNRRVKA
jgi:hypothetical protein